MLSGLWPRHIAGFAAGSCAVQDVDGQLRDFQDKQNIDIGLIMGRNNNNASTVSERMPVIHRSSIMRMGATRSLSVSECLQLRAWHSVH